MNFDLSEEQELFRSSVERFTGQMDSLARRRLRSVEGGYDRARWTSLADLGLIALGVDAAHGGLGGTAVDLALVGEALGQAIAPDPWLENGILPMRLLSGQSQVGAIEDAMAGKRFVAAALFERGARFSLAPRQTTAQVDGGDYVLNGEKTFVLGGALADAFIVSAELGGQTALFLVPADAQGIARRSYRVVDGSMACELQLFDLRLPSAARVATDAAELDLVIADIRLLAASEMLGLGQRLFDETLAYVKQREQFGVAIGTFQALQHRLVDCYSRLEQARSMLYLAALADRADAAAWRRAAAGAKVFIGENAEHIAREAVQMHGGMGITEELAVGHAMKRILLLNTLFGDADAALVDYAEAA